MDNIVDSKPSLPKAEPDVNTGDWRARLPSDSRKKNANKISSSLCSSQRKAPSVFEKSLLYLILMGPSLPTGEPAMGTNSNDWRTQLPPDARQKIVNKIMGTLKNHLPLSGPEGINELWRISIRFEEKIFSGAVNLSDYLRKISMKMLAMETKAQKAAGSSSISDNSLPLDLGHLIIDDDNSEPSLLNEEPAMNTGDWRSHLPPDSRQKNVNNLMETLKKHVPYSGQEGINELMRIAVSFEELIFNTTINQADYFYKISLKMQTMEEGD